MRQLAKLSLYGINQYYPTLLDGLVLPESVDRDLLVNNLLIQSIDREVLYPQPEFLAFSIAQYSQMRLPTWEHMAETLTYEYNPVHNYDRTEYGDETEQANKTGNRSNTGTETGSGDNTVDTTGRSQTDSKGGLERLETKDYKSSDTGSGKDDVRTDYNRNLVENTTSNTTGTLDSRIGTDEETGNTQTTKNVQTFEESKTGNDKGQDSGQDVVSIKKGAYNLQPGMASVEEDTTQFGKGTSVDHTESTNNTTTLNGLVTDNGTRSVDTTQTDNTTSDTTGKVTQTGTTDETRAGTNSYSKNTTDSGTLSTAENTAGQEISDSTGKQSGEYHDTKNTSFKEDVTEDSTGNREHRLRAFGNIGVTTTQELIRQEREIAEFNIYDYIIGDLIQHFCLLVY